jgi:hypothetical protein
LRLGPDLSNMTDGSRSFPSSFPHRNQVVSLRGPNILLLRVKLALSFVARRTHFQARLADSPHPGILLSAPFGTSSSTWERR